MIAQFGVIAQIGLALAAALLATLLGVAAVIYAKQHPRMLRASLRQAIDRARRAERERLAAEEAAMICAKNAKATVEAATRTLAPSNTGTALAVRGRPGPITLGLARLGLDPDEVLNVLREEVPREHDRYRHLVGAGQQ